MDICVEPESLKNISREIYEITLRERALMDKLGMIFYSTGDQWQGSAEKAFAGRIVAVKNQFMHINSFFEDYAALIKQAADMYENHEKELSSKINCI